MGVDFQPGQQSRNAAGRQRHAGVSRPVVQVNRVTVSADGLTAREDDLTAVSATLLRGFRAEDPAISALQT